MSGGPRGRSPNRIGLLSIKADFKKNKNTIFGPWAPNGGSEGTGDGAKMSGSKKQRGLPCTTLAVLAPEAD